MSQTIKDLRHLHKLAYSDLNGMSANYRKILYDRFKDKAIGCHQWVFDERFKNNVF